MNSRIAIIGATGLVGRQILSIMAAESVPAEAVGLFASESSAGEQISYRGTELTIESLASCEFGKYGAALFCVGDELSAQFVPMATAAGCAVVDKSNAFRLDDNVPLVVYGVNDSAVTPADRLVANPNCTTIVLCHALNPLAQSFGISSIWAATYQSASGAGKGATEQLKSEVRGSRYDSASELCQVGDPQALAFNTHCQVGGIRPSGQCSEEHKLVAETRKILSKPDLTVIAHTVRVPVLIGHGIAVTVQLARQTEGSQIISAWDQTPAVRYMVDELPTPVGSSRHNEVEVGRLRREPDIENGWSFFVCGDNVNIGAALNGWHLLKLMQAAGAVPQFSTGSGGN